MNTTVVCPTCNKELSSCIISGLDLFCSKECRKNYYDKCKCSRCGQEYKGEDGWQIPTYESYSDTKTLCSNCVEVLESASKRIKEIDEEIKNLRNLIMNDVSDVYVENGDYYIQSFDCDVSFNKFKKAVDDYESRKIEIENIKENNKNIYLQIDKLEKEINDLNNILFGGKI